MRDLLINVENIWLGGFKAIFAHQTQQPQLLANFQRDLVNALNRHIPSRKARAQKPINLDPRILGLFTGLGDPSEDGVDLDEPLMDLLYLVVDILQFNGEQIAYDEVDFDSVSSPFHQLSTDANINSSSSKQSTRSKHITQEFHWMQMRQVTRF
jgi:separase